MRGHVPRFAYSLRVNVVGFYKITIIRIEITAHSLNNPDLQRGVIHRRRDGTERDRATLGVIFFAVDNLVVHRKMAGEYYVK